MSIPALMLGRGGSGGLPGKNVMPVLGRPLMAYALMAANESNHVERSWVSSDSEEILAVGRRYGADSIVRPPELCTDEALGEDAYRHGYLMIKDLLAEQGEEVEMIVLLFANAPTITADLIDQGVEILRADPSLDSAVTVSRYNMWSPLRARKLNDNGTLDPFVPFEVFGDPATLSCDRDSQGDVWYADMGVSIVRPHCLEELHYGILPQRWMGRKIAPIESWGGCDIDYPWQIAQAEHWLREHGIEEAVPGEAAAAVSGATTE
ncbi:MAG: CMP-N,N-diacetyllegionaminic acid synthase [Thermoleophilaceae bacterium]|jgi:CMP-N-acetylneuraminic acid synthetase|nr:CMP-N,N-diacetyllegionaminic acid synthase [Thermoleophilaceae bacterium]